MAYDDMTIAPWLSGTTQGRTADFSAGSGAGTMPALLLLLAMVQGTMPADPSPLASGWHALEERNETSAFSDGWITAEELAARTTARVPTSTAGLYEASRGTPVNFDKIGNETVELATRGSPANQQTQPQDTTREAAWLTNPGLNHSSGAALERDWLTSDHPSEKKREWLTSDHTLRGKGAEWLTGDHSSGAKGRDWLTSDHPSKKRRGAEWLRDDHSSIRNNVARRLQQTAANTGTGDTTGVPDYVERLLVLGVIVSTIGLLATVSLMFQNNNNYGSTRDPPSWNPDEASTNPFRDWASDVLAWSIASNMDSRRKAAAVRLRLQGPAKRWARSLPPNALVAGGMVAGVHHDPMVFLIHSIASNWGDLGKETAMAATMELNNFSKKLGENSDSLIIRFELVRDRASQDGGMDISIRQAAVTLLTSVGPTDEQLQRLLDPTDGLFPSDEPEYTRMVTKLRRMGHIIEGHHNNIAKMLRPQRGRDGNNTYHIGDTSDNPGTADPWTVSDPWGGTGTGSGRYAPSPAYPAFTPPYTADVQMGYAVGGDGDGMADSDCGTDTDTVSSRWSQPEDFSAIPGPPPGSTSSQVNEHLFWAYQRAKSNWRRHSEKPVRRARRFIKRYAKGKEKVEKDATGCQGKVKARTWPSWRRLHLTTAGRRQFTRPKQKAVEKASLQARTSDERRVKRIRLALMVKL